MSLAYYTEFCILAARFQLALRNQDSMTPANLRIRADLMQQIRDYIGVAELTQQQAAQRFGVAQPRISEIVQGKCELFTVDKLVNLLERVGQHVEINCKHIEIKS